MATLPDDDSVTITGFASGGEGVGRLSDGRVVFVEGGLPGERVELLEVRSSKKVLRARAGKILDAAEGRVTPRCEHFGVCGGCRWQHVDYPLQLEAKRQILIDALRRIGGIRWDAAGPDGAGLEIVASPDAYGYRGRARWVESGDALGYRVRGSKTVSPVEDCPVLVPAARAALVERVAARRSADENGANGANDAKNANNATVSSEESPGVRGGRRKPARAREWVVTAGASGPALVNRSAGAGSRGRRPVKPQSVSIEAGGETLRVSGGSFVQGNALLYDALVAGVRDACTTDLENLAEARFVELYSGIGFFTIPLARRFASGVALESDRSGLADLAYNLRKAGVGTQVEVLSGRVETRGDLAARLSDAAVLLVDPPRIGLDPKVRAAIESAGPARVVYLSCDPATLARDLRGLTGAGYQIRSIRAFDLFPQTPHVETLVRLERSTGN